MQQQYGDTLLLWHLHGSIISRYDKHSNSFIHNIGSIDWYLLPVISTVNQKPSESNTSSRSYRSRNLQHEESRPASSCHHYTSTMSSGDPESPICARITLTGVLEVVPTYSAKYNTTLNEGFHPRHPQMSHWPIDHNWIIFKLNITQYDIWLINYFGGAIVITQEEYFPYDLATTMLSSSSHTNTIAATRLSTISSISKIELYIKNKLKIQVNRKSSVNIVILVCFRWIYIVFWDVLTTCVFHLYSSVFCNAAK